MESKAKALGHPIHQMLVPLPFGLLAGAAIFDVVYLIWGNPAMTTVSYWMIAAGVIGGLVAAPFGLIDYLAIPAGTRAKSVGLVHGVGNVIVLLLFVASWWLRYGSPDPVNASIHRPGVAELGWLGGELVARLSVGVDEGAHLDAPNSIFGKIATRRSR